MVTTGTQGGGPINCGLRLLSLAEDAGWPGCPGAHPGLPIFLSAGSSSPSIAAAGLALSYCARSQGCPGRTAGSIPLPHLGFLGSGSVSCSSLTRPSRFQVDAVCTEPAAKWRKAPLSDHLQTLPPPISETLKG